MVERTWDVVASIWPGILVGTGLILIATGAGWSTGQVESSAPVKFVAWWIERVILPLLRSPRWIVRAGIIFLNNAAILALLVFAGRWSLASIAAIAFTGLNLGIGLRVLARQPRAELEAAVGNASRARSPANWKLRVGMVLNLLEPPAILLTLGLSLRRSFLDLSPVLVWETFLIWVIPATLAAAGGEALWLGVTRGGSSSAKHTDPAHKFTGSDQS